LPHKISATSLLFTLSIHHIASKAAQQSCNNKAESVATKSSNNAAVSTIKFVISPKFRNKTSFKVFFLRSAPLGFVDLNGADLMITPRHPIKPTISPHKSDEKLRLIFVYQMSSSSRKRV
jgi:hypothetical protein